MKKTLLTLIIMGFSLAAIAQHHIHLKSGVSLSSFVFKDSESIKNKNLTHVFNNYSAVSYDADILKIHVLRAELGFRQAGAKAIVDQEKYEWNFNYLDVNLAYLIKFVGNEKYGLHVGAGPYLGFLLSGEQSIGDVYYNVKKERAINTLDLGLNFLANGQFKVSENISISLEYRYGLGLLNVETDGTNPDQVTRNKTHYFLAGLSFNLINKKNKEDESK